MAKKDNATNRAVVIGLGRFGGSVAMELMRQRTEVLAIDSNPKIVDRYADRVTHAAVADSTDDDALRQLGVHRFHRAVVAIGTDLEASILTTSLLGDFAIPSIWAKGLSRQHASILERVGAHHVVLPEHDMGERVAHLVMGRMLDYIEFEDDYAMVKTTAPAEAVGRTLGEAQLRSKHKITVVSIKRRGEGFSYATAETVVRAGDLLIVAGKAVDTERFAELT
ncbi:MULTISPECIES: potassium channel family protein [Actinoalloteichus]|uniref:K+ transport system, NAD-binding component n=1 Tax=Actinoalloteichus fjordicus TaxID=1612552 RepID=A0AAC9PTB5_9PSEU|nr:MULTISPECIES: TrkA family potassium uptake protein [Actinoalloteichus]APU15862.1 K+ transport system, NAD-binding component [Actinoalloteichus fjordicus]APU21924.1 K+ transport system, NAD-binding component [Actinoalloteichus sp. GBA129-24]